MRTRNIYSGLVMTAAALLCLAGCKKDEEGEKIMLGTQFEKAVSAQKTYLGENNTVCWSTGDEVNVNGTAYPVSAEGIAVEEDENGYAAVYPATNNTLTYSSETQHNGKTCIGGTVVIPATQTYTLDEQSGKQVLNGPMAARLDSRSGKLYFRNLYSLLKVTVSADDKNFTVNTITVTATGETPKALAGTQSFEFKGATNTVENLELTNLTNSSTSVKLTGINSTVAANSDADFYLAVHPMTAQNLTVKVEGVLDNKMVVYTYNTASARSLNRNSIGGLGINLQQLNLEPGSIGEFNIGTAGAPKYVTFAPGNLQYQASTQSWRFAEHQWDIIGDNAGNTTKLSQRATQSEWIDLFRWGATGLVYKNNQCTDPYMPYELENAISKKGADYAKFYHPDSSSNINPRNYPKCFDWGTAYNQKNGTSGWRTLSKDEWKKLLDNSSYKYVKITDLNLMGYLLHPEKSHEFRKNSGSYNYAEYSSTEISGYLFLPKTGYQENNVVSVTNGFNYWSTTTDVNGFYALKEASAAPTTTGPSHGVYSAAVRLVKDID